MTKPVRGKYGDWITKEGLIILEGWARDGLTDKQIAHNIGIARSTLYGWKKDYPVIDKALRKGKEVVDREVESSLYRRAIGSEYVEERVTVETFEDEDGNDVTKTTTTTVNKVVPTDTTAAIFWLKNRKPKEWNDKKELELSGKVNIEERARVFNEYLMDDEE